MSVCNLFQGRLLLAVVGLLLAIPASSWGDGGGKCPASERSVAVSVRFESGQPFVDDIHSLAWIQEQAKGMHQPIGLTVSRLKHTLQGVFEWRSSEDRKNRCLYLRSLTLELSYPELKVYIANAYRPGSCEYQAIYRHEMEHVRILKRHHELYVPHLRERLQAMVYRQEAERLSASQMEQKKQEVLQRLDQEIQRELHRLDGRQKAAQAEIDTPRSYAKVRAECRHW
ncbi:MAG: hypothetical protein HQM06_00505 [Magnetococcales bacterium]|nr:hypothetical protein [Magnetococcales bacterium]